LTNINLVFDNHPFNVSLCVIIVDSHYRLALNQTNKYIYKKLDISFFIISNISPYFVKKIK